MRVFGPIDRKYIFLRDRHCESFRGFNKTISKLEVFDYDGFMVKGVGGAGGDVGVGAFWW